MYEGYLRNRRTTELLAKLPRPPGADNSIPLHPIQFLALSGEGIPLSTDKFATLFGVFSSVNWLCLPCDVSPTRIVLPEALPSTVVTRFIGTMASPTPFPSFRLPRFYTCRAILSSWRTVRVSHVHSDTFETCHALRPRRCHLLA